MKSIIQSEKECYISGSKVNLHEHHVFYGSGLRKKSEKYGLKVYLCHERCHLYGVHKDAELNRRVQKVVQKRAMQYYKWSVEDFRAIFGRSYI